MIQANIDKLQKELQRAERNFYTAQDNKDQQYRIMEKWDYAIKNITHKIFVERCSNYIWLRDKPDTIVQVWYCNKREAFFIYDPTCQVDNHRILYRQIYIYNKMGCKHDILKLEGINKKAAVDSILAILKVQGKNKRRRL